MKTDPAPAHMQPPAFFTPRTPLKFAGIEYATLTFAEPTAGAWEAIDGLEGVEADTKAISITCGIPAAAIAAMGVRDFRRASRAAGAFFTDQPDAGGAEAETLTIPLRAPVTLGEDRLDALALREPTAAEWRTWEALSGTKADIRAVAAVTGARDALVRMVPISEVRRAAAWIGRFFTDVPVIGAQS